ncbi:MAG: ribose transport system permease protein [Rhodospirillaceae bacterium]|jgi:ribose transport system permease protein|nr:ribose transport system permease protein [Rhodospirillaceae bacterium]
MFTDTAIPRPGNGLWQRLLANQAFWVTIAVFLIPAAMTIIEPSFSRAFWKEENFFNVTRNFAFIAIIALGQVAVMITGGIDLSVGSVLAVCGIVLGLLMTHDYSFWFSACAAILTGIACGLFNGYLISYLRLSPFVVTLGMLSIGRSLALAISNNKFFYQFGHDQKLLIELGGGKTLGLANPVIVLVVLTLIMGYVFRYTRYGRHLYAIGGNENAARLAGVPVDRLKVSVYVLSGFMTAISAILSVGWLGSVTNGIGIGYELRVIASTVIGGANLLGGEGGAYAAFIGAALIEVIRNSLLLAGVDPYWQGTFVGLFIIFAVLLERLRGRKVN